MSGEGLEFPQHDLVAAALQPSCTIFQIAPDGAQVIGKHDVAGLLPPHDHVVLAHGLLDSFQRCPDHNMETKVRMFL